MFVYEKRLQYPVKIQKPNPHLASLIVSQYGGPNGELGASLRYLSQRYTMPNARLKALLTDIGTEESALQLYQRYKGPAFRRGPSLPLLPTPQTPRPDPASPDTAPHSPAYPASRPRPCP